MCLGTRPIQRTTSSDIRADGDHPHIAFFTQETFARMLDEAIDTIRSFKEGNLTNQVPSEYLRVRRSTSVPGTE
jgi:hypothetical protein